MFVMPLPNPRVLAVLLVAAVSAVAPVRRSHASFVEYHDLDSWSAVAGSFTTLDFVFPQAMLLNSQYSSLGVLFPDGEEVALSQPGLFLQDGWGVKGSALGDADVHLVFLEPQTWIGVWFPGDLYIEFYAAGELLHTSNDLSVGGQSINLFGGVVSTIPFDEVRLVDPFGLIKVDDILFGAAVPGPSSALLLGAAPMLVVGRRRRT